MTTGTYIINQPILLKDTITNPSSGTLTDDATTSCTVYLPDGTSSVLSVIHDSLGVYTATFTPSMTGWHEYVFRAINTGAGAGRGRFYVSPVP